MPFLVNVVGKLLAKRVWRKLFPKYTKDELRRKTSEQRDKIEACIQIGDRLGANTARRKAAQYQLKILRITYLEDIRLIKERIKSAKSQKKE